MDHTQTYEKEGARLIGLTLAGWLVLLLMLYSIVL